MARPHQFLLDGYLAAGVDKLEMPLAIEVKYFSSLTDYSLQQLAAVVQRAYYEALRAQLPNILVVHNLRLDGGRRDYLTSVIESLSGPSQIFVWDRDSVNDLAARVEIEPIVGGNHLESLRREAEGPDQWQKKRDEYLLELNKEFQNGNVSLFLGSGVSKSSNLPSWDKLISDLFVSTISLELGKDVSGEEQLALSRSVMSLNTSPLRLARYLRSSLDRNGDGEWFHKELTASLYKSVGSAVPNALLNNLIDACVPTRTGARICSVVTYNFDDLLETELRRRNMRHRSIYDGDIYATPEELPIYHVHGFLPRDPAEYDRVERSLIVFSEKQYHLVYSDSYHWTNLAQLGEIRDRTCVFIGLSLTDPNLRRLLELGTRYTPYARNYALMRRVSAAEFAAGHHELRSVNPTVIDRFLRFHHLTEDQIFRDLGVTVIWFETYSEIADAVGSLSL